MNRKSLALLMVAFTVFLGFMVAGRPARASEDHTSVELDGLIEIADDPAALATVHYVDIYAEECDGKVEKGVSLITKCPNLEYAHVRALGLTLDKGFFNGLSTSADKLELYLQQITIDLSGVNNPYVTSIFISECTVQNYGNIVKFGKLQTLSLDSVTGFGDADYRKLTRLTDLLLVAQRIDDYRSFFQKTANVRVLGLDFCNLQNKDTRYLVTYMKALERISLAGTYVDDINFLKDLKKLKGVVLPSGVSELDILYEMPYLEDISFDAYTELFVDEDLMEFFDKNGIAYPRFDKDIRLKVEKIVGSLNITDKTPVSDRIETVTEYVLLHMEYENISAADYASALDMCISAGKGVCHDYAVFEYTLLKCVGVDAYVVSGYSVDTLGHHPGSHVWNEVCIDGKWYGVDPTWLDDSQTDPTTDEYKAWAWTPYYMQPTKVNDPSEWPADLNFNDCQDLLFSYYHRTMNDPLDTLKGRGVIKTSSVKLDKTKDSIICGGTDKLKATPEGILNKVTWESSDKKIATVDAKGNVTAKSAGTVTITAVCGEKKASCEVTVLYKDVNNSKDFWFAPTNYLTAKGVVKGYDKQTLFKPAAECTRAQMVTFIWRLQGEPEPKSKTCKFTDVKEKDYFYKACIWGNEKHIVEGYKDGTFGPKIVCARKHAVTFLWRLANKPSPKSSENKFSDVKKSDYFYKATLWASEKGILAGYKDGTFKPDGNCLRRQMVTFLYKYDKFVKEKG